MKLYDHANAVAARPFFDRESPTDRCRGTVARTVLSSRGREGGGLGEREGGQSVMTHGRPDRPILCHSLNAPSADKHTKWSRFRFVIAPF